MDPILIGNMSIPKTNRILMCPSPFFCYGDIDGFPRDPNGQIFASSARVDEFPVARRSKACLRDRRFDAVCGSKGRGLTNPTCGYRWGLNLDQWFEKREMEPLENDFPFKGTPCQVPC